MISTAQNLSIQSVSLYAILIGEQAHVRAGETPRFIEKRQQKFNRFLTTTILKNDRK